MPKLNIKPIPYLDKLGNKSYLVVLGLILFIEIIVFKNYFFEKLYFFKDGPIIDSLTQYYPFEYLRADYIAKYGIPKWSFNWGMGQSIFQFFLHDPFDIFLDLAGKDRILYLTIYKELSKILFGGLIFFFYLKTLQLSNYTSIIGSLLFSFCGFMIMGNGWYIYSFEAFNMALLLLAFELLFSKQKWYLFPLPIFLFGVSMPFNLFLYGIFLACYAVLRHLQTGAFNFKKLGTLFLKMIGLGIVGLLLSAPFLIENIMGLFESPRGSGNSSYTNSLLSTPFFSIVDKMQLGSCIMHFFSSDQFGSGSVFKDEPMFYCGLPCLLLMPQVFQFLDKRVRIVFIVFLTVWLLPIIFPYFRYALWLFTGDYYRAYSFFVALIFLYYSAIALEFILQQRKINMVVLITTIVILLILINYRTLFDNDAVKPHTLIIDSINTNVYFFVIVMLIIYGMILFFIPKQKNTIYLKYIFLAAVICELSYLSYFSVNKWDALTTSELPQKTGYNDYSVDAVSYIKQHDKSFYRIDKSYGSAFNREGWRQVNHSLNDGMVQGYYGTSCYSSFNQVYYVNYLELMGLVNNTDEFDTRWAKGLFCFHYLQSENSVKYILTRIMSPVLSPTYYDSLTQIGDVKILRNKFALPLGYTYNYFMKESRFKSLSFEQKNFVSIRTCVIKDSDVNKFSSLKEYNGILSDIRWEEAINELKKDTLLVNQFGQNNIAGTINVSEDKMMYLSLPYDVGWKLKVDGQPTNKIILNAGMTGVMLRKGNHTIELNYELPFINEGLLLSALGILIYFGCWFFYQPKV